MHLTELSIPSICTEECADLHVIRARLHVILAVWWAELDALEGALADTAVETLCLALCA